MAKLYELTQEQQHLYNLLESGEGINQETGEIDPVVFEQLKLNGEELKEKALATAIVYKQLMSDYMALYEEEKNLSQRRKRIEKSAESLKNYLSDCLVVANLTEEKLSNTKAVISFRKSEATNIIDENIIPERYKVVKTTIAVSEIRAVLRTGIEVPGAELIENQNIQIK